MKKRTLGRTGLQVTELSLGGLFISKLGGQQEVSTAAVAKALELGVNYIDTAPTYADSEVVLGKAFAALKLGPKMPFLLFDQARRTPHAL